MKSSIFLNEEVCLLFAIRSKLIDCKMNFKSKYGQNDILCRICFEEEESQLHIFHCKILNQELKSKNIIKEKICYEDIYGDVNKQKVITVFFANLLEARKQMLENKEEYSNNLSNPTRLLGSSYDVQPSVLLTIPRGCK